jgi:hypothetical protein
MAFSALFNNKSKNEAKKLKIINEVRQKGK